MQLLEPLTLATAYPEIYGAIENEERLQLANLELIASAHYASRAVREATASVMTNKYAEGYPGKRYYGGCEYVDIVEQLAIDRARQLFGADFANVQPHSGSQANAAAYLALVQPGDPILGMSLDHGGHLTHGAKVNFSGKYFRAAQYGIRADTGEIDYAQVQRLAEEHRPKMIIAGFSAYSRIVDWARFAEIARGVGAYFVVDMAHVAGLVAAGLYPNPLPHADVVTTTTHKTLRGPRGGLVLCDNELAEYVDRGCPMVLGGPLPHVMAAKAVALAEGGANFLEVYRFFLQEGYPPRESYQHSMRIFRGSLPADHGPFTKDLCYSKGFVQIYNFMRLAVSRGMVRRVPLLFCGKTNLADVKVIAQLMEEGLVTPPRFITSPFADLHALSAWLCYANFLNKMSKKCIEEDYATLL